MIPLKIEPAAPTIGDLKRALTLLFWMTFAAVCFCIYKMAATQTKQQETLPKITITPQKWGWKTVVGNPLRIEGMDLAQLEFQLDDLHPFPIPAVVSNPPLATFPRAVEWKGGQVFIVSLAGVRPNGEPSITYLAVNYREKAPDARKKKEDEKKDN